MTRSTSIHLDRPSARVLLCLGLALVAFLALGAGRAAAQITSSHITVPTNKTFGIYTSPEPAGNLLVKGTTDSTEPAGDLVDIYCFGNGGITKVASLVPLAADGSFRVEIFPEQVGGLCRLRALPAGQQVPENLVPYTGPINSLGNERTFEAGNGPNEGKAYDFRLVNFQFGAGDEFNSIGSCGYSDSDLINSAYEPTTYGFVCADYFWRVADEANEASSRSEMQVDGVNAYFPASARYIDEDATGLPTVTMTYHQDPTDGDLTVEETEPLVACNTKAFPPTHSNCTAFVPTGVVDTRTIQTTEAGRLVTIADHYSSTDGAAHGLDMLNQQGLIFNQDYEAPQQLGFRFPGQSGYSTHTEGDVVSLPSTTAPGVIYSRYEGKSDGDETTGRAAIVYDRPASSATFNGEYKAEAGFYLHQTATVPASGATTIRFAYAQGYDQAQVEALAGQAVAAFGGSPVPPAGGTGGSPVVPSGPGASPGQGSGASPGASPHPGGAVGRFVFGHVTVDRGAGTAKLTLVAPGAGRLALTGTGVRPVRRQVGAAGPVVLTVRPTGALATALAKEGQVRVRVKVAFTPTGGLPTSLTRRLVLVHAGH